MPGVYRYKQIRILDHEEKIRIFREWIMLRILKQVSNQVKSYQSKQKILWRGWFTIYRNVMTSKSLKMLSYLNAQIKRAITEKRTNAIIYYTMPIKEPNMAHRTQNKISKYYAL